MTAKDEASLGSALNGKGDSDVAMNAAQKRASVDEPQEQQEAGVEVNAAMSDDTLLWEEELAVRREVFNSPISGNFLVAIWINLYSAMHIFVVYLISLEMLLSVGLSVGMTICKLELFWAGPVVKERGHSMGKCTCSRSILHSPTCLLDCLFVETLKLDIRFVRKDCE